ncbi:MAG: tRNA pseudouridine(13) synthase TruD [Candidatus Andersenbacteria bacterium]|nr:tRNA pseudouridine(13) synthase TruD [Candidatus Andersenbacteria bacterium]
MISTDEAKSKEQKIFEWYRNNKNESLIPSQVTEEEIFHRIGIAIPNESRPQGYLRLYPEDFIVEEVSQKKEISKIEPSKKEIYPDYPFCLGCNLVKAGISTFDAQNLLANEFEIKPGRITYAGLKDVNAITSQKIVFLDLNAEIFEKIKKVSFSNLFLTNFHLEEKGISPGKLYGNRFTILLRTEKEINEQNFSKHITEIKEKGFLNFYSTQRFGVPRFSSHTMGKLILQGKFKETIFTFFTEPGLQEIPLIKEKREKAKNCFGDWEKIEEIFSELPFTFRNELQLLSYLKENPTDFTGALIFFKDQTRFWTYAYSSYLFNKIISIKEIDLPETLPLLLSNYQPDKDLYRLWLEKDEIKNFEKNISPFRFIQLTRRFVKTRLFPENILFKTVPEGIILSFILEKGAYATTFLANFFEIKEGLPLPKWVKPEKYDTKKLLGAGSVETVKENFGENTSSPLILF